MPSEQAARQLALDFDDMRPMFFRKPPTFQQILDYLRDLEKRINERGG